MLRSLFALFLALGWALPASASAELLSMTIHDVTVGHALTIYAHDGQRYVAGRTGNEYQLRLRNPTGSDLLAVVSVDGVNVITGETAAWEQSGYVVPAGAEVVIRGWRKNLARVAAFYFAARDEAYATRTGRPSDLGVIGVAVFRPRVDAPGIAHAERDTTRRPGQGAAAPGESIQDQARMRAAPSAAELPADLGTGHGRSQVSRARYTTFQRSSSTPSEIVTIRYDTHANLVAAGVIRPLARRAPNPFPGRFVPDPN